MLPIGVAIIDVFSTRLLLPVLLWTLSRIPIFFLQFFVLGECFGDVFTCLVACVLSNTRVYGWRIGMCVGVGLGGCRWMIHSGFARLQFSNSLVHICPPFLPLSCLPRLLSPNLGLSLFLVYLSLSLSISLILSLPLSS